RMADHLKAGVALVHHSTKGSQADKRVTDVGAGAGAQSRAADAHLILREHEDDRAVVLEAAVRSFAPVQPLGLRFEFPLWVPDESLDVGLLKGARPSPEDKQAQRNMEADGAVLDYCEGWRTRSEIRTNTLLSADRCNAAIARLLKANLLEA